MAQTRPLSPEAYAARVAKRMYAYTVAKKRAAKKPEDGPRGAPMFRFTKRLPRFPHWVSTKSGQRCVVFVPGAGLRVVPNAKCRKLNKAIARYYILLDQRARERGKPRYMPPLAAVTERGLVARSVPSSACVQKGIGPLGAPELLAVYESDGTVRVPRHRA